MKAKSQHSTSLTVKVTLILAAGLLGRASMRRFSAESASSSCSCRSAAACPLAVAPWWSPLLPRAPGIAGVEPASTVGR
jgi:hypothetical protein